jgi:hypothetical protein
MATCTSDGTQFTTGAPFVEARTEAADEAGLLDELWNALDPTAVWQSSPSNRGAPERPYPSKRHMAGFAACYLRSAARLARLGYRLTA